MSKTKGIAFTVSQARIPREMLTMALRTIETEKGICREMGIPYVIIPVDLIRVPQSGSQLKIQEEVKNRYSGEGLMPQVLPSLKERQFLLRSLPRFSIVALEAIEHYQGQNFVSIEGFNRNTRWPNHVSDDFLNRKVGIIRVSDLPSQVGSYGLGGKVFAKLLNKPYEGWGVVANLDEMLSMQENGIPYNSRSGGRELYPVTPESEILVSQPIEIASDNKGTLEYRAWILDNQIVAVTRYNDMDDTNIPDKIKTFFAQFANQNADKLLGTYSADAAILTNSKVALVEVHPITEVGSNDTVSRQLFQAYITNSN